MSVFKDFQFDNSVILLNCFEFDYALMKKPKFKEDESKIKEALRVCYPKIREAYRIYAALGMVGNLYSVALNVYTEFIKDKLNMIDDNMLKMSDSDRLFITVNATQNKSKLIPSNALVRF